MPHPDSPPAYSSSGFDTKDLDDKATRQLDYTLPFNSDEFLSPFQPDNPSFAVESALSRGLQVPSRSEYITSGFANPSVLAQCGVSQSQWDQFTREILQKAKLSRRQWTTAVGKGLGVLAVGGVMFGFLGAIPAVLVARKARRNREEENFITATCSAGSDLSRKIKIWNETFFQPRGILIRVDLPSEALADLAEMDISSSQAQPGLGSGTSSDNSPGTSMSAQSLLHRLRIRPAQSEREEASYRARIVIIPHSKQAIAEQY